MVAGVFLSFSLPLPLLSLDETEDKDADEARDRSPKSPNRKFEPRPATDGTDVDGVDKDTGVPAPDGP